MKKITFYQLAYADVTSFNSLESCLQHLYVGYLYFRFYLILLFVSFTSVWLHLLRPRYIQQCNWLQLGFTPWPTHPLWLWWRRWRCLQIHSDEFFYKCWYTWRKTKCQPVVLFTPDKTCSVCSGIGKCNLSSTSQWSTIQSVCWYWNFGYQLDFF